MTKPQMVSVNIPFPGFYESWYSQAIDREEEQFLEWRNEPGNDGPDYESNWPEALNLCNAPGNAGLWSILFDHSDYSAARLAIARDYVAAFDYIAGEAFGMAKPQKATRREWNGAGFESVTRVYMVPTIGLQFEEMTSPREYNFQTDRLFALVPLKVMRELFRRSKFERHETLGKVIRERFTSYSGFHSFYSNALADWLAKPLAEWDHNELGTLLIAALHVAGEGDAEDGADYLGNRLYEATMGDEGAYRAWESCVDWPAFESARNEARGELFAEWAEEDPDGAREWLKKADSEFVALITDAAPDVVRALLAPDEFPPVRCPYTLELFPEAGASPPA